MPLFARRAARSTAQLAATCRHAVKLIALLILPAAIFTALLADPIVLLLFRSAYLPAVPLLRSLIRAGLLLSFDQRLSTATIAARRQDLDLLALLSGASVTIPLIYFLTGRYGAPGAAAGLAVAGAAMAAVILVAGHGFAGGIAAGAAYVLTLAALGALASGERANLVGLLRAEREGG